MTTGSIFSSSVLLISARAWRPSFLGKFRSSRAKQGRRHSHPSREVKLWIQLVFYHVPFHWDLGTFQSFRGEINVTRIIFDKQNFEGPDRCLAHPLLVRDGEKEGGSLPRLRFHPNLTAVAFNDLLTNRQAYAGSWIFVSPVQPLEYDKYAVGVLRIDTNTVVSDREKPAAVPSFGRNMNTQSLHPSKLDGIAYEILKELHELRSIGCHCWKRVMSHLRTTVRNRGLQVSQRLVSGLPHNRWPRRSSPAFRHATTGEDHLSIPACVWPHPRHKL